MKAGQRRKCRRSGALRANNYVATQSMNPVLKNLTVSYKIIPTHASRAAVLVRGGALRANNDVATQSMNPVLKNLTVFL